MSAHTPTPWQKREASAVAKWVSIRGEDYDHAVRCVNAHDALVSTLRNLLWQIDDQEQAQSILEDLSPNVLSAIDMARAALAKAEAA